MAASKDSNLSLFRTLEPPPVTVVVLTCPMTAHLTKAIFLELLVSNVEPLVGLSKPEYKVRCGSWLRDHVMVIIAVFLKAKFNKLHIGGEMSQR